MRPFRTLGVVVSTIVLTTLATNAVDMRGDVARTMVGSLMGVKGGDAGVCPEGMVLVTQALTPFCIDRYEASAGDGCLYDDPQGEAETVRNVVDPSCTPVASVGAMPWRFVSQVQARQLCSRAGKRLPTANEWYKASLGTPDEAADLSEDDCNVARNRADGVARTGDGMRCVSDASAFDMVGNVWEWIDDTITDGAYGSRPLPPTGFVAQADVSGFPVETTSAGVAAYGGDRAWFDPAIVAGTMRGGYYESGGSAGLFALYAASPPTFTGDAVGFRCAVTPLGR